MARMIDGDAVTKRLRAWLESPHGENVYNSGYDDAIWHVLDVIEHMPTLTQPPITGDTSDGYHTFNELYHHRVILFSVICNERPEVAWKSKRHHDGTMYDGMFIVGIDTPEGQATYHYDIDPYWNLFRVKELELAPEWDGHTPGEAIRRIGTLTTQNEPLALEQLREMDGEPVWVEDVKHWALIDIEKGGQWDGMPFATWQENGVRFCYNIINRNLLCYRRPPEGEGKPTEPPNV